MDVFTDCIYILCSEPCKGSKFASLKLGHIPIGAVYFNLYETAQNIDPRSQFTPSPAVASLDLLLS